MSLVNNDNRVPQRLVWLTVCAGIIAVSLTICLIVGTRWFRTFVHVEDPVWYLVVFHVAAFLFCATIGYRWYQSARRYRYVLLGVVGYMLSVLSAMISHLLISTGVDRFSSTLNQVGVVEFSIVYLIFVVPLGGWLIVPVSHLIIEHVFKRLRDRAVGVTP